MDPVPLREEEGRFLLHLTSCGVPVQKPVPNTDGAFVTILSDGTPATALTWIPGRTVEKADRTPEFCADLGRLVANMHLAAKTYIGAPERRYDAMLCENMRAFFAEKPESPLLAQCRAPMDAALGAIGRYLSAHETELVPVHSDLSLSNLILTGNALVPIDFSLFGVGHSTLDIGGIFAAVLTEKEQQRAFSDAYCDVIGGKIDLAGVDAAFALQILLGVALHYALWENEAWFAKRLPEWCRDVFSRVAAGDAVVTM